MTFLFSFVTVKLYKDKIFHIHCTPAEQNVGHDLNVYAYIKILMSEIRSFISLQNNVRTARIVKRFVLVGKQGMMTTQIQGQKLTNIDERIKFQDQCSLLDYSEKVLYDQDLDYFRKVFENKSRENNGKVSITIYYRAFLRQSGNRTTE